MRPKLFIIFLFFIIIIIIVIITGGWRNCWATGQEHQAVQAAPVHHQPDRGALHLAALSSKVKESEATISRHKWVGDSFGAVDDTEHSEILRGR